MRLVTSLVDGTVSVVNSDDYLLGHLGKAEGVEGFVFIPFPQSSFDTDEMLAIAELVSNYIPPQEIH